MTLWMMGGGGYQPPFNRTFFNVSLGEILARAGKDKDRRLTLYLVDGTQLDVRAIVDLSDHFVTVGAGTPDEDSREKHVHVLPYSSIYRIEVAGSLNGEHRRLGFHWTPFSDRGRASRSGQTKRASSSFPDGGAQTEEALTNAGGG
jgi:hypothetical protein